MFLQNQLVSPPPNLPPGRRKQRLVQLKDTRKAEQQKPETVDAERLEDVLLDEEAEEAKIEEALKEVSTKPKK